MVSVIIPSRSAQWLKKTVEDLLNKAGGEVEVVVVYDGRWAEPDEMPPNDPRVVQIHHGLIHDNYGMRESINAGVRVARGQFIMVLDEQCAVSQGYDVRLSSICEGNWVIVPRRYRLDPENWKIIEDGRKPIDYMYIEYPYRKAYDKTQGLHGAEDRQRYYDRKNIEVDDLMTMQGSCYFMKKTWWDKILPNGLDSSKYGNFTMEAQEVSMTTWLSGGRVVVDKASHYVHWHKGSKGRGYAFTTEQYKRHQEGMEKGRLFAIQYWLSTQDYEYDFAWLIKKFWPVPGWKETWKTDIITDREKDYSTLKYKDDYWLSGLRK